MKENSKFKISSFRISLFFCINITRCSTFSVDTSLAHSRPSFPFYTIQKTENLCLLLFSEGTGV